RVDESLRVKSTVEALTVLRDGGYVGRDDGANLIASYEFLRLLEHCLQLQRLKRTHTLPEFDDYEAMRWLMRSGDVPPALFVSSDQMSRGVLKAAHEAGIRVP
ncbi:substrate-binding domain-containing protein, partial [Priestia sp. SIMBA_032]|uniref:[protein-PII] uridylyltransferase family protein n=1 Tax=Priestia sp. SIMBA_032 TaxID=3085775 RepID=UPI00397D0DB1